MKKEKEHTIMSRNCIIRIIICALLFIGMGYYLSCVFTFPRGETSDMVRERFNTFYAQEKNTMDAVYIGSSGVDRYWIPASAWQEYGIAVYDFTSGNQPTVFAKYMIEEALKYQDAKLFIIDVRGVMRNPENINDTDIRRVTDNMRFSTTRIKATRAVLDYVGRGETEIDTSDPSYYFPLMKYHSKWNGNLPRADLIDLFPQTEYMGYFAYNNIIFKEKSLKEPKIITYKKNIPKENEKVLLDLLDYCDSLKAQVLFVSSPQILKPEEQANFNYVFDLIEARGYPTLNFNTTAIYDKIDWDFEHDMYNPGHANIDGALKYTSYLGKYIQNTFSLEDHRSQPRKYEKWDKAYQDLLNRIKEKDFELYEKMV